MTIDQLLTRFGNVSIMELMLFLTLTAMIVVLTIMQFRKDSFDVRWLIMDEKKRPSIHKIATLVSLVISSWAFVYQVLHGTLTEMYFILYMSTWTGSLALNRYLDIKDKGTPKITQVASQLNPVAEVNNANPD